VQLPSPLSTTQAELVFRFASAKTDSKYDGIGIVRKDVSDLGSPTAREDLVLLFGSVFAVRQTVLLTVKVFCEKSISAHFKPQISPYSIIRLRGKTP